MKKTDFIEIKTLDVAQLRKKLVLLKKELADLVMEKNMKKLSDKKAVFKKRKDIAQILTVVKQKELLSTLELKEPKVEKRRKK